MLRGDRQPDRLSGDEGARAGAADVGHQPHRLPGRVGDLAGDQQVHAPVGDVGDGAVEQQIARGDILHTYAGVRPLCDDESDQPSAITRDYTLALSGHPGEAPLLSVFGGKLTTYRKLAESALSQLAPYFSQMQSSWTASAPLPGGEQMSSVAELSEGLCQQ